MTLYSLLPTEWICLLRSTQPSPALCIIYPVPQLVGASDHPVLFGLWYLSDQQAPGAPCVPVSVALFKMINCVEREGILQVLLRLISC